MTFQIRSTTCIAAVAATLCCTLAQAAETPAVPPSPITAGSMLQMLLGLAVVLALVAAMAWIMKRLGAHGAGPAGAIKVIAGAAVGQRERVVLVEVAGTWLVLGVAPGRVNALHSMPRTELPAQATAAMPGNLPFAEWLKRMMEQRRAR